MRTVRIFLLLFFSAGLMSFSQPTFSKVFSGDVVNDAGISAGACWGDYNNDGYLDLFVANWKNQNNFLYLNHDDGNFTRITEGAIVNDGGFSSGPCWGDYDNDGFLDLFVANAGTSLEGQNDFLYRNNGDGTFTKIEDSPIIESGGYSHGGVWGDFDSDGDLDLFHANWENQNNIIFQNNTSGNNWIKIKCRGIFSNKNGIGAKVYVLAVVENKQASQMREIRTNNGCRSQSGTDSFFGLADAQVVKAIIIKWPSGEIDKTENIKSNQTITLTEGKGVTHISPPAPEAKKSPVQGLFQLYQKEGSSALLNEFGGMLKKEPGKYILNDQTLLTIGNYVFASLGKTEEAKNIFEANIQHFPKSAESHAMMGRTLVKIGQKEQAMEYFNEALILIEEDTNLEAQAREDLVNGIKFELKNLKYREVEIKR